MALDELLDAVFSGGYGFEDSVTLVHCEAGRAIDLHIPRGMLECHAEKSAPAANTRCAPL